MTSRLASLTLLIRTLVKMTADLLDGYIHLPIELVLLMA